MCNQIGLTCDLLWDLILFIHCSSCVVSGNSLKKLSNLQEDSLHSKSTEAFVLMWHAFPLLLKMELRLWQIASFFMSATFDAPLVAKQNSVWNCGKFCHDKGVSFCVVLSEFSLGVLHKHHNRTGGLIARPAITRLLHLGKVHWHSHQCPAS